MNLEHKLRLVRTCAHGVPLGPLDEYLADAEGVLLAMHCADCQSVEVELAAAELVDVIRIAPRPIREMLASIG
jgi:hypothetical protein